MLIQLLVEREGDEHVLKVEGVRHTFRRNGHGHLVAEVTNPEYIRWMIQRGGSSYCVYQEPKLTGEILEDVLVPDAEPAEEPETPKPVRKLRAPSRTILRKTAREQ